MLVNDVRLHYAELGAYRQAGACFSEALVDWTGRAGDGRTRAVLLQNLGAVHNAQRQYFASLPYHAEAAGLFGGKAPLGYYGKALQAKEQDSALGQRRGLAESLGNLAYAYSQLTDYQAAAL
ncbi:hypothetical protein AAFF_G00267460 [Aldrovandia affinis]|uniref:Tetratricopeptide repeat protein n=1 Tax=Aldrovandia affinis TaxID=143900 RepID=A0AAD7SRV2_9TELE|nr:hypothetical protein AAFF_G00267460 [Aldrovandia affinis]